MQTIKTGIVVALLLAVCYGAFVAINTPEAELPSELEEWAKEGQLDNLLDIEIPQSAGGSSTSDMSSLPNTVFPSVSLPATLPTISLPETLVPTLPSAPTDLHAIDGPAIKLPPTLGAVEQTEANSLLIDVNSSPTKAKLTGSEYPAIPLVTPKSETSVDLQSAPGAEKTPAFPASPSTQSPLAPFAAARTEALKQTKNGDLKGALVALTAYYNSPELPHSEHTDLLEILDALAREVIYSQRHLLAPAHIATAGETIASVAAKHQVTTELLSNINQLKDANALIQDQQIKVVDGPFRAEVDLNRGELTVFLKDMYATRFPIAVGEDPVPNAGQFVVADKRRDRIYYSAGNQILPDDPKNPYGGYWIDLGNGLCIHGTAESGASDLKKAGCISLSPIDAADVYIMLTQGSQIEIRR